MRPGRLIPAVGGFRDRKIEAMLMLSNSNSFSNPRVNANRFTRGGFKRIKRVNIYSGGFTLIEMMIVVMILGILAGIAVPSYLRSQERTYTKEAIVSLRLLRAAQMVYRSEFGTFYPGSGSEGNISDINTNLRLNLTETNWDYDITASSNSTFTAQADRLTGIYSACVYTVDEAATEPVPVAEGNCP